MKQRIKDIIQEFKKVQWPNWDTLQSDSIVVAVASVMIALVIYVMDQSFNSILGWFYSIF
jgi:preprotein translocase subunit SecE|tara:strand:+ start:200 stop:379 length:180 start_codon:yes stop_codon:yes gene_type:complete